MPRKFEALGRPQGRLAGSENIVFLVVTASFDSHDPLIKEVCDHGKSQWGCK